MTTMGELLQDYIDKGWRYGGIDLNCGKHDLRPKAHSLENAEATVVVHLFRYVEMRCDKLDVTFDLVERREPYA